jgi:RNA polymerase sigma factor (sigma-70 family)
MSQVSNQNTTESDLINGCIAGNRQMQELLYRLYAPKMYAVCLRYSTNAEDAQDLLQEGFIKVYRNIDRFRGDGSFEGWIRRIFVNTSIEQFRKKTNVYSISEREEENIENREFTALDTLAEKDIINLVQELSPGYRTVFNMYVIEGYSHKEIGEMLGINEGTSKSQLARAKGLLQKMVEKYLNINDKTRNKP